MHLLAERFKFTRRVGELKAQGGLPPADPERDRQQIARLTGIAEAAGLDPEFAEQFRAFIVREVIRHHERIAAEHAATGEGAPVLEDRKSTRLNSSHVKISYAVFCLKNKRKETR